jgi:predicted phosphodiesterase
MEANKVLTTGPERGTAKAYSEAWHEQFNKLNKPHQSRVLALKGDYSSHAERDAIVNCFVKEVIWVAENGPLPVEDVKDNKKTP